MMLRYGARGCSPWPKDDGHQKREKLSMGDKGKKDKGKKEAKKAKKNKEKADKKDKPSNK